MINNKGFISISIVYSFFIVFLSILLLMITTYVNNRVTYNIYKNDIKNNLAQNTGVKLTIYNSGTKKNITSPYSSNNGYIIQLYNYTKTETNQDPGEGVDQETQISGETSQVPSTSETSGGDQTSSPEENNDGQNNPITDTGNEKGEEITP